MITLSIGYCIILQPIYQANYDNLIVRIFQITTTTTVTWTGDGWKKDVGPGGSDGRAPDT